MKDKVVISNLLWRFAEKSGIQIVNSIVTIIVARLIEPEDFGVVALATSFISLISIFVDNGIVDSLIQKKDADDLDFSTVFFTNIFVCVFLYSALFLLAPLISNFYGYKILTPLIRVCSLKLLISIVHNVQHAYVSRNMIFKKFFFASLAGTIIAGFVGVIMAYAGYGIWALVAIELIDGFIDIIVVWFTIDWKPKLIFSLERLKYHFNYGWKILAAGILNVVHSKVRELMIGKMYSSEDLAFYNKGDNIPRKIIYNLNRSISSILLPVLSKKQDNIDEIKKSARKALRLSFYIFVPILFGLFAVADSFVSIIFTDKWLPAVPYIRIMCFVYLFLPMQMVNSNIIKSIGRSDVYLYVAVVEKVIDIVVIFVVARYGVLAIAISVLCMEIVKIIIEVSPNKKLINYGVIQQMVDVIPIIVMGMIMLIIVMSINLFQISIYLKFIIQIIVGIITYVSLSKITKIDEYQYVLNLIKEFMGKVFKRKRKYQ